MNFSRLIRRTRAITVHIRSTVLSIFLRVGGASVGPNLRVYGRTSITGDLTNLVIGSHVTLNEGVVIDARDKVRIGDRVRLSAHAQIHSGALHTHSLPRTHWQAPITIESDVWIASGAIVLPGVTIGCGSVIAANAVVRTDAAPNSIIGGVPGRVIGATG